jgi:hypothetical protein
MQQENYDRSVDVVASLLNSQIIFEQHVPRAGFRLAAFLAAHFAAVGCCWQYLSAKRKADAEIWYTKYPMRHLTSQSVWVHIYRTAQRTHPTQELTT